MDKLNNRDYFLALSSNFCIGSKTIFKLEKYFGDLEQLWHKDSIGKLRHIGLGQEMTSQVIKTIQTEDIQNIKNNLSTININYITHHDDNYPRILREISDPPAVLYYKGKLPQNDQMCFGVVGSRKYSSYGKRATEDIVAGLVRSGLTIISGLALGIDAVAHQETLKQHGVTIGVLGCGLDMIYPSTNIYLAQQILKSGGAIVSEYPPKVPPYKSNFVLRNRIIAGLSLGILVVEAAKKSGTLLTAKAAIDYNREVFAVPGSIYSYTSEGANNLIKYGAKPVTTYTDILDNLNIERKASEQKMCDIIPDNKFEKSIIDALRDSEGVHIDKLSKICDLRIDAISSHLTLMEMKGKIRNLGGNIYVLNNK